MSSKQKNNLTQLLMTNLVENNSNIASQSISQWIVNINSSQDTMLLLVGNCKVSEDLVLNKTIKALFNTGIVSEVTSKVLSEQSIEEIARGKLFLYINHTPHGDEQQQKLRELITSIVIDKSINSDGYRVATQAKIIVAIDKPDMFFKDFLEISTTLFIEPLENILEKFNITSAIPLYRAIELSLDSYSDEIRSMPKGKLDIRANENQRYLESLDNTSNIANSVVENTNSKLDVNTH